MTCMWNLALTVCQTITLEGIGLHHWFASDPSQLYYQALFRASGSIAVRTAHAIVYNPDDDAQTDKIRQILQTVPVFPLPLPIYTAKLVPPFRVTNLTFAKVLKSTPHWDPEVYSKVTAPRNPEYVTATESHEMKAAIDQSIKTMGPATDEEWFTDVGEYKEEIAIRQSSDPPMLSGVGNTTSLEPPVLAVEEADDFMEQLQSAKWPRFAALIDAGYNVEIHRMEAAILFLYKQISKAKAAKERIIVNEKERKKLVAFMLASQKSLEAKQQALKKATGAAEKNRQEQPSLLTSLPQNPSRQRSSAPLLQSFSRHLSGAPLHEFANRFSSPVASSLGKGRGMQQAAKPTIGSYLSRNPASPETKTEGLPIVWDRPPTAAIPRQFPDPSWLPPSVDTNQSLTSPLLSGEFETEISSGGEKYKGGLEEGETSNEALPSKNKDGQEEVVGADEAATYNQQGTT